jgi:hypothetical protein
MHTGRASAGFCFSGRRRGASSGGRPPRRRDSQCFEAELSCAARLFTMPRPSAAGDCAAAAPPSAPRMRGKAVGERDERAGKPSGPYGASPVLIGGGLGVGGAAHEKCGGWRGRSFRRPSRTQRPSPNGLGGHAVRFLTPGRRQRSMPTGDRAVGARRRSGGSHDGTTVAVTPKLALGG